MDKLCFSNGSIWLGHRYNIKWVCERCNNPANLKGLISK